MHGAYHANLSSGNTCLPLVNCVSVGDFAVTKKARGALRPYKTLVFTSSAALRVIGTWATETLMRTNASSSCLVL